MWSILCQEIRQRLWFTLWWCMGLASYMALVLVAYPPFREQAGPLNQTFNQLPGSVKSLLADTGGDFLSPVGYMGSNAYYILLPVLFGILVIGLGSSLLARDEQDHTLELLLSRPVSRTRVLLGKAFAGIFIIAVVTVCTIAVTLIMASAINLGIPLAYLVLATVMVALMTLLFGSLAFAFTASGRGARLAAIGISTLLFVASYLFTSLSGTVHWLEWPAKVLPYNFYHPADIMTNGFTGMDALGMAAAVFILGIISILAFRRRDID